MRMMWALLWGGAKGTVVAFSLAYLEILRHWDPMLLAICFGSFEGVRITQRFKRSCSLIDCKRVPAGPDQPAEISFRLRSQPWFR